jgi:CheY-like chemotaxis protein
MAQGRGARSDYAVVTPLVIIVILAAAVAAVAVHALWRRQWAGVAPVPPVVAAQPSQPPVAKHDPKVVVQPPPPAPLAAIESDPLPVAAQPPPPARLAAVESDPPVAAEQQPPQPPATVDCNAPVQRDGAASGTILLVEDDDDVRGSTVRILERAGFEVLEASSAAAAINVWQGHDAPIDLVLSDVVMPGTSGVELAAEITALSPGAAIILISGFTPAALAHHRLLSGDDEGVQLLQKPLPPAELVAAVRSRILAGRSRVA